MQNRKTDIKKCIKFDLMGTKYVDKVMSKETAKGCLISNLDLWVTMWSSNLIRRF